MNNSMIITMRLLDSAEREAVYTEYMTEAFPASELKPLAHIESLIAENHYLPYGFYEGEELIGYAYFVRTENTEAVLLDYFAVLAEKRSHGYGSRFLARIREELGQSYRLLLLETENPMYAKDEADKSMRERRMAFYLRNGMRQTGIWARIVLDRYVIMACEMGAAMMKDEITAELAEIYAAMFDRYPASVKRNDKAVGIYKIYDGESNMQP